MYLHGTLGLCILYEMSSFHEMSLKNEFTSSILSVSPTPFLTHYHTMPHFSALKMYTAAVENIVRKGEIACNKQILLISQCFLPLYSTYFLFQLNALENVVCNLFQFELV